MPPLNKWSIDLNVNQSELHTNSSNNDDTSSSLLPPPLGMKKIAALEKQTTNQYSSSSSSSAAAAATELSPKEKQRATAIIQKKNQLAMGFASSPAKNIMMSAFMMYMSGSNLNIWTINTISMAILTPIANLFGLKKKFAKFQDADGKVDLTTPMIIWTALNLIWLYVGLYKMSKMRLLPTYAADWSGRIVWKEMSEISSIPPL